MIIRRTLAVLFLLGADVIYEVGHGVDMIGQILEGEK